MDNHTNSSRSGAMPSISFSAPFFSDQDEKEELEEISDNEREEILDDVLGRNLPTITADDSSLEEEKEEEGERRSREDNIENTDTAAVDNVNRYGHNDDDDEDADVTDEHIFDFDLELEAIPETCKREYLEALEASPGVVETESCPSRFLRAENYNSQLAVLRLTDYWKMRIHIFGRDAAFKPMSLRGCMKNDLEAMLKIPNWFRVLPPDRKGRTVVCIDRTNIIYNDIDQNSLVKQLWFIMHKAIEDRSTQKNGIVLIVIDLTCAWDMLKFNTIKVGVKSLTDCLPIKFCCLHICYSSLAHRITLPIMKYFMNRHMRRRIQLHTNKQLPTLINDLETFGLSRSNLPISIGGSYTDELPWINQCERLLEHSLRRRKRQNDRRNRHHNQDNISVDNNEDGI